MSTTKLKTEIENAEVLTASEKANLFDLMAEAAKCQTIERVYNIATAYFGSRESAFEIYRGGHHVAVHHRARPSLRVLMIAEIATS